MWNKDIDKALYDQAKAHKQLCRDKGIYYCVDCKGTELLESDHLLCKSKWPQYQLCMDNLALRCGQHTVNKCNQVKAQRVYHDFRTYKFWLCFNFKRAVASSVWPTIIMSGVYYGIYLSA